MISRDDWLSAVKEATEAPLPESDALTVQELADMLGMRRHAAQVRLQVLVANGKAVKTTKRIRRSGGSVIAITAYRLVE